MIPPTVYAILYLQDRNLPYLGHPLATHACMTHGTRVRYVLGWSLLASRPVLHCEELSISRGYEGRLIQAVRFEPPLQLLTRADLARLLPFQPGARCVRAISATPSSGSTRPESIRKRGDYGKRGKPGKRA